MVGNVVAQGGKKKFSQRAKEFFKGTWAELKKVHWPTKKEVVTYTGVVLAAVLNMAVVLWILDSIFSLGLGGLFKLIG